MLKKIGFLILISSSLLGCGKKPTPTPPPPPTEENIVFTIDPDPGAATQTASSGTYTFKVNVTSKMPTSGVKIDFTTKQDATGSVLETKSVESTISVVDISTSTLASGTLYNVTVTVTSKSKSTNTASKTFKVARK